MGIGAFDQKSLSVSNPIQVTKLLSANGSIALAVFMNHNLRKYNYST
jgi:hypothetical protein